jgi:hypothetical protein
VDVPEVMQRSEMASMAKTYGKFWCTWQAYRVDSSAEGLKAARIGGHGRAGVDQSQRWLLAGGFAVDVVPAEMKRHAPFPWTEA